MVQIFQFLGMKRTLVLFLCFLVFVVALQNFEPTPVQVLFWTLPEMPKVYLLCGTFIVGALAGYFLSIRRSGSSFHEYR